MKFLTLLEICIDVTTVLMQQPDAQTGNHIVKNKLIFQDPRDENMHEVSRHFIDLCWSTTEE